MSESGTRYAVITADNQSANIWVCAIIAVAFSTACMAVRIINRSRFAFKFGIDDYTFAGAWVCHYLYEHLLGLGKDHSIIDPSHISSIQAVSRTRM
jgi:hypothetical protein